jgi:hypothetical protein
MESDFSVKKKKKIAMWMVRFQSVWLEVNIYVIYKCGSLIVIKYHEKS